MRSRRTESAPQHDDAPEIGALDRALLPRRSLLKPEHFIDRETVKGLVVDRRGTRIRDDAFWVEREGSGYRVYVSITDLASLIDKGSVLDLFAEERQRSMLLSDHKVRPMLPECDIYESLSLSEGASRLTITAEMLFNADGENISTRFYKSCLQNIQAVNADRIAEISLASAENEECLRAGEELARTLIQRARDEGLDSGFGMRGVVTKDPISNEIAFKDAESAAELVVNQLMQSANKQAALLLRNMNTPAMYSSHGPLSDFIEASGGAEGVYNHERYIQLFRKHVDGFSPSPIRHHGIGEDQYLRITSPIRSFSDLVNQRILLAVIDGKPNPYSASELAGLCRKMNDGQWQPDVLELRRLELANERNANPREDPSVWSDQQLSRGFRAGLADMNMRPDVILEALNRFGQDGFARAAMADALLEPDFGESDLRLLKTAILHKAFAEPSIGESLVDLMARSGRLELREPRLERNENGVFTCRLIGSVSEAEVVGAFSANKESTALKRSKLELLAAISGISRAELPDQTEFEGKAISASIDWRPDILTCCETLRREHAARVVAADFSVLDGGPKSILAELTIESPRGLYRVKSLGRSENGAKLSACRRALRALELADIGPEQKFVVFEPRQLEDRSEDIKLNSVLGNTSPKKVLAALSAKNSWGEPRYVTQPVGEEVRARVLLEAAGETIRSADCQEHTLAQAIEGAARDLLRNLYISGALSLNEIAEVGRGTSRKKAGSSSERLDQFAVEHNLPSPSYKQTNLAPSGGKGWRCELSMTLADGKTITLTSDHHKASDAKLKTAELAVKKIQSLGLDI